MNDSVLSIWTVYDSPRDWPGWFVARQFDIVRGAPEPVPRGDKVLMHRDLEGLRRMLPPGLHRMPREPGDEPQIVESWI